MVIQIIHRAVTNKPLGAACHDRKQPEPTCARCRDRTLVPVDHFAPRAFVPAWGRRSRAALRLEGWLRSLRSFRRSAKRFTLETLRSPAANFPTEATGTIQEAGQAVNQCHAMNAGRHNFRTRTPQVVLIEE